MGMYNIITHFFLLCLLLFFGGQHFICWHLGYSWEFVTEGRLYRVSVAYRHMEYPCLLSRWDYESPPGVEWKHTHKQLAFVWHCLSSSHSRSPPERLSGFVTRALCVLLHVSLATVPHRGPVIISKTQAQPSMYTPEESEAQLSSFQTACIQRSH